MWNDTWKELKNEQFIENKTKNNATRWDYCIKQVFDNTVDDLLKYLLLSPEDYSKQPKDDTYGQTKVNIYYNYS